MFGLKACKLTNSPTIQATNVVLFWAGYHMSWEGDSINIRLIKMILWQHKISTIKLFTYISSTIIEVVFISQWQLRHRSVLSVPFPIFEISHSYLLKHISHVCINRQQSIANANSVFFKFWAFLVTDNLIIKLG